MKLVITVVLGLSFLAPAIGAPLSPADRKSVVQQARSDCMAHQKKSAEHSQKRTRLINEYCDCVGDKFADNLTSQDATVMRGGDFSPVARVTENVYAPCLVEARKTDPNAKGIKD